MLPEALDLLVCPHCRGPLDALPDGVVGCFSGHRFDLAKHGHLALLGPKSRTDTADTAEMIAARMAFLGAGHYAPIAVAVTEAVTSDGPVLELGAGTGYYLAAVVDAHPGRIGLAVDSSKYAARRAASVHSRVASVVADAWSPLPIRDAAVSTVLSVFAPRVPAEIARVLEPGGRLVVVTPLPGHLAEVAGPLGLLAVDEDKHQKLAESFDGLLTVHDHRELRFALSLTRADAVALASMGPAAYHRSADQLQAAAAELPGRLDVTAAVTVTVLA